MGSILQERVAQRCVERLCIGDREWKKKAPRSTSRPNVAGTKMGRRQSQRKFPQPQCPIQGQENNHEKKPQRRKHNSNTSSTKCSAPQHSSAQGTSMFQPAAPEEDRMKIKVSSAHADENRKHTHPGLRASKHTAALLDHGLPHPSPDQQEELSPQEDSDTDLSESERLPLSSRPLAPRLELRPEVVEDGDAPSHCRTVRGRDFPDFLPPPFNSWSLSQLAVFYNTEGRGAFRPRPTGPLERYLERLLQLEWHQIQTVQAEHGTQDIPGGTSSCQRSSAATPAPTRLSSPKCILQCQRAFPLSFLSSLAGHAALLAGGTSGLCRICSSSCSASCCRSTHCHRHLSRLSPDGSRGPLPRPKRSYSESRVHSSDRRLRTQRSGSPSSSSSYLRRMQASGNIRNPIQAGPGRGHSSARGRDEPDWTAGVLRKRSGSEQRRGGGRRLNRSETSRSSSESRTGRAERGESAGWAEQEVTGVSVRLPGSRHPPVQRPSRSKQVEFVT
ncbi:protein FAM217B-like isoform X1 [Xiphophorus maculatus]|uniref:Protein FAM217B-like n=1 Tax=Xiphophorus maculatus TaxID=8083 RepID=A0A3B5RFM1_XIPMA|nr:protein FAM217B-like isoform X1 [Xiphophorus maculatus]